MLYNASERERQVANLLLEGSPDRIIAGTLGIAIRTVKSHVRNLSLKYSIPFQIPVHNKTLSVRVRLAVKLHKELNLKKAEAPAIFTPREYSVISLVALGYSNSRIARTIGTTEDVIKNYMRVLFDKVGVWNRMELALWVVSHNVKKVKFKRRKVHREKRIG